MKIQWPSGALARLGVAMALLQGIGAAQSAYLPLAEGAKWVLKSPATKTPVVIEVLERRDQGFLVRFASPFATNDWLLAPRGEKYFLTKFGMNGQLMDLPDDTLYFDFGAKDKAKWSSKVGNMSVASRSLSVQGAQGGYDNCVQIKQGGNAFAFASGKGFVQFGEGKNAFVLDEGASAIGKAAASGGAAAPAAATTDDSSARSGGRGGRTNRDDRRERGGDSQPVQHVPTPGATETASGATNGGLAKAVPPKGPANGRVLFSITPNVAANEDLNVQNLLKSFDRAMDTGVSVLIHNAKWSELEPSAGKYNFDSLNFNVQAAKRLNIPIAYTFRLIETVDRAVPADLKKTAFSDRKMEDRVMKLIDQLAPKFEGRVKWFNFGNEVDGYFGRHKDEVAAFAQLYGKVARRLKQLQPGMQVSSTLMFGGVETMDTFLLPLAEQLDFVSFTYYPLNGDFTMQDPSVVGRDVDRMRRAANGRKLVLQEIGYPSGSRNKSNEDKQAQFVENVFREMRANSDFVEAGCFWLMADLKDEFVRDLGSFYGINNSDTFKSFLQTLGMHDGRGKPKKAWDVFTRELKR